jgi:hypothetical protein
MQSSTISKYIVSTATACMAIAVMHCPIQTGKRTMETVFSDVATGQPLGTERGALKIRDVGESPAAPAVPGPDTYYQRRYGSSGGNSRVTVQLPDLFWKVSWQADLGEGSHTQSLLVGETAVVVQQEGAWRLFDRGGKPVKQGARGEGDVLLDAANGAIYLQSHLGLISIRSVATGEESYLVKCHLAEGFARTVLRREGRSIVVHSVELPHQDHTRSRAGEYSFLELLELGTDSKRDILGISESTRSVKNLVGHFMPSLAVATESGIVVAGPDGVLTFGPDLKPESTLQGEFFPLAMSLSGGGQVYLLLRVKEGGYALWGMTLEGERFMNVALGWNAGETAIPPILSFDDAVYLVHGDTVEAFGTDGRFLWNQFAGGTIAGAVVTANNKLLVSAGRLLTTFTRDGERRVMFELPGDSFRTPTIPTSKGELFVASDRALYCLVPLR